jgi:hypothetical protein
VQKCGNFLFAWSAGVDTYSMIPASYSEIDVLAFSARSLNSGFVATGGAALPTPLAAVPPGKLTRSCVGGTVFVVAALVGFVAAALVVAGGAVLVAPGGWVLSPPPVVTNAR